MAKYNFKAFHIRSMNASTEEEKKSINQELKDLYANLPEKEKVIFNEELQHFLVKEMATITSLYRSAQSGDDEITNASN